MQDTTIRTELTYLSKFIITPRNYAYGRSERSEKLYIVD